MERRGGNLLTPNIPKWNIPIVDNPANNGRFFQADNPSYLQVVPDTHGKDLNESVNIDAPLIHKPNKETVGSDAFDLEYFSPHTSAEVKRDIESYLKEYRLKVQKHHYHLLFGRESDGRGPITIRDEDRGEALTIKAKRSIISRKLKKQPVHREEAELEGLSILNEQLRFSNDGDTVFWASPPGPKEQGYGEYGFIYMGKVTKISHNESSIAMQAIRIENPTLDQYNAAFSEITGEDIDYQNADLFLARPRIIHKHISDREVDSVLQRNFRFVPNEKDINIATSIIIKMDMVIEDFVELVQHGTKEERIKAFYSLENYALKLKDDESKSNENVVFMDYHRNARLDDIIDRFGFKAPEVKGSCGSSGGNAISNSLSSIGGSETIANIVFGDDEFGSLDFECSKGHPNTRPRGKLIPNCRTCGESVAC